MIKKQVFLFILGLLVLLSVHSASLGLRSNNLLVGIEFEPYFEQTYYYTIVTYENKPVDIEVYVTDDKEDGTTSNLSQYFVLSQKSFRVLPKQEPYFSVTVKLPERIAEPGRHVVHVGAVQSVGEGEGFKVRTGIEALFSIIVAYPGKYLKYSFDALSVNQGMPLPATVFVSNLGTETIRKIYADITISDINGVLLETKKTEAIELKSKESRKLSVNFTTTRIPPGSYNVSATIHHDDGVIYTSKIAKVGELSFNIIDYTDKIEGGTINEILVAIESLWANSVENVFAEITIGDEDAIRTITEVVHGFEKKILSAFFDASNIPPGVYPITITLHFENKKITKQGRIEIAKKNRVELPSVVLSTTNVIFLIMILIILVINIALFFILLKKKDEHEKRN